MELYNFLRGVLVWTATVACLWPVNVPLLALAYRISLGPKPIEMEKDELWTRSAVAALLVAGWTLLIVLVDYLLADWFEFPAGPVHIVALMGYFPVAVWILFVFFAYTDLLEGVTLFTLYIYLPVFVLYVLNAIVGFWNPLLRFAQGYLKAPA